MNANRTAQEKRRKRKIRKKTDRRHRLRLLWEIICHGETIQMSISVAGFINTMNTIN